MEIRNSQAAIEAGDFETAWVTMQRAHILGQAYFLPYAIAHWQMLKLALRQRDAREISGLSR
ncbi:DUF3703 domain-containing protein [Leptolyngbya sp. FACHB-261]|uniref:DUF3703 domain-containing protein n=1 Tax=Leptolyngbya sp. FACHB-261 TaxID=2692806 RepID=UPI0037BEC20C